MRINVEFKSDEMRKLSSLVCRTIDITKINFLRETMLYHAILFDEAFMDEQGRSA